MITSKVSAIGLCLVITALTAQSCGFNKSPQEANGAASPNDKPISNSDIAIRIDEICGSLQGSCVDAEFEKYEPKPVHAHGGEVKAMGGSNGYKEGRQEFYIQWYCSLDSKAWSACSSVNADSSKDFERSAEIQSVMRDIELMSEREKSSLDAGDFSSADSYRNKGIEFKKRLSRLQAEAVAEQ